MTAPADDSEPTRAQLERIAFGRAESPAEIAEAQDALRRLVEADAASVAVEREREREREVTMPEVTPGPAIHEDLPDVKVPAPRRKTLVPVIVVVGLFAGAAIGVLVAHPAASPSIGAAPASSTPAPAPTADAAAALKSLLVPQTEADKEYPLPGSTTPFAIQPASVHRILTSPDGTTLWTGRSDTGICLMWSRDDTTNGGISAESTCATPSEFAKSGLTLSERGYAWTWNGILFTTTVGY
ncbi:MAG TPA: hypothetical protein VK537_08945 [Galbitalea sp.]|nr:hypothetical protein [Galbitalea sp.]